jgi:hypothetical protein
MSLWMMGGGGWQAPFSRTFFNVALGEILERAGKEKGSRLTLYLVDGSQLDVRAIEDLSDQFFTVTASLHDDEEAQSSLHVLPYSAIYRIEVARAPDEESRRVGFRWIPFSEEGRTGRKIRTKGIPSPRANGGESPVQSAVAQE